MYNVADLNTLLQYLYFYLICLVYVHDLTGDVERKNARKKERKMTEVMAK